MSLDIRVTGISETLDKMRDLRASLQKRVIVGAGRAALKPVVAAVRARVPRDTGTLAKSIGVKQIKRVPKGEVVLSVGARRGFDYTDADGKKHDPFFYAIPVEYGHAVKNPTTGTVIGYIAPAGMFRAAYEHGRMQIVEDFAAELRQRVEAAIA